MQADTPRVSAEPVYNKPHIIQKETMRQIRPIIIMILAVAAYFTATPKAQAQSVAVKTNLLYDATLTPNLGVEMGLGKRTTAQLSYGLNPWKFSEGKSIRHWQLVGEGRYWFCSKFNGHFLGVHAMGGQFNMAKVNAKLYTINWPKDLKDNRYEGWNAGLGVTYGYQWILSRHWNVEAAVGVGYNYIHYKKNPCEPCGTVEQQGHKNYFGPTKLALSLMYVF